VRLEVNKYSVHSFARANAIY